MKTQITISLAASNPTSAVMTKFMKTMAFNPNEGRLATWLFRLPGMKLPSIRPAQHLYLNQYLEKVGVSSATLLDIFPRAKERSAVIEYFKSKKISQSALEDALIFVKFLCSTVVNTSPVFRAHFGDAKVAQALIHYTLYGKVPALTPTSIVKILETLNEKSVEFNPKSLKDVDVEDLKTGSYSELEVAAKLNRFTKDWFANSALNINGQKTKIAQSVGSLQYYKEKSAGGSDVKILNKTTGEQLSWEQALKEIESNVGFSILLSYTSASQDPVRRTFNPVKVITSFLDQIYDGTVAEFYKTFPDIAGLCTLCSPQFASAINEFLGSKYTTPEQRKLVPSTVLKEAWMSKYVGSKLMQISKLPTSATAHTWMKIQALPGKEVGPWVLKTLPKFDIEDIQNLRTVDLIRILVGVGTEYSLTTVFSDILNENLFKRKFLSAAIILAAERRSPFGTIPRAISQKNYSSDDPLLDLKFVHAWTPIKTSVADFQKKITRDMPILEVGITSPTKLREELNSFMWNGHEVDFEVLKHWKIPLSTLQHKHLAQAKLDSDSFVIRNGFHGTSTGAAGAVLMSGFRMSAAFVTTGQSMGSVLYIAPNIDKSVQYIGTSFGRDSDIGIIFRGDLVLKGNTAPKHANDKNLKDWTLTDEFATEEIGLVHPNSQYLVQHAYLVRRTSFSKKTKVDDSKKVFAAPVPAASYSLDAQIKSALKPKVYIDLATTPSKFDLGARVVVKVDTDEWHTGTVSALLKTGIKIDFDDGATATVRGTDVADVHLLLKPKISTKGLTDKQASKFI